MVIRASTVIREIKEIKEIKVIREQPALRVRKEIWARLGPKAFKVSREFKAFKVQQDLRVHRAVKVI